jgi:hypothetical protein
MTQDEYSLKPVQHCNIETICRIYRTYYRKEYKKDKPCPDKDCKHDTRRSRPAMDALETIREKCIQEACKCESAALRYPNTAARNGGSSLVFRIVADWIEVELRQQQEREQG